MDDKIELSTGNLVPEVGSEINKTVDKPKEKSEKAYKIFDSGIKRAENLLNIDSEVYNIELTIPNDKLLDAYRAVIVLSISALDGYIKTFLMTEVKQRLEERNLSNDLKKYIKDELFTKDSLHDCVLNNDFYEKVIAKFEDDFEKKSFQGAKSIEKYMKLAGFDQIFKQITKSADKSIDNLLRDIDHYTQRRHLIVHCGDHDLNQTNLTENTISKEDASNCISLVKLIACEIHKLSQSK